MLLCWVAGVSFSFFFSPFSIFSSVCVSKSLLLQCDVCLLRNDLEAHKSIHKKIRHQIQWAGSPVTLALSSWWEFVFVSNHSKQPHTFTSVFSGIEGREGCLTFLNTVFEKLFCVKYQHSEKPIVQILSENIRAHS